jgi:hypothetical protein
MTNGFFVHCFSLHAWFVPLREKISDLRDAVQYSLFISQADSSCREYMTPIFAWKRRGGRGGKNRNAGEKKSEVIDTFTYWCE